MKHPIQPLWIADDKVLRFRENAVVRWLLDNGGKDMNDIARQGFDADELEHFAQLIGYSHSGAGDLSYVSDETWYAARKMYDDGLSQDAARAEALREILADHAERLQQIARIAEGDI